jgi:hypothetical protein
MPAAGVIVMGFAIFVRTGGGSPWGASDTARRSRLDQDRGALFGDVDHVASSRRAHSSWRAPRPVDQLHALRGRRVGLKAR